MNKNTDFEFYYDRRNIWTRVGLAVQKERDRNRVTSIRSIKLSSNKTDLAYRAWGKSDISFTEHEKGLFKLKKALALNPNSYEAAQEIVNTLKRLKRLEEVLVYAKKVFELSSNGKFAHVKLLKMFQELGKFHEFEQYYEQYLDRCLFTRGDSRFYFYKAEALVELKEHALSLPSYKMAVELAPETSHYHFQYGMALYYEGLWKEALETFEKVIAIDPTNRLAYNNVAFLNYNLGHIDQAIDALEYIVENDLEIYATYSNLILMNYHLHQNKEAIMPYAEKLKPYIITDYNILKFIYNEDLKLTELKLSQENIDEETKEWNRKKLSGLKLVISFIG